MAAIEKGQSCGLERHELEPAEAVLKEAPARGARGARNVWMVYFMEILLKWMITRGIALW